MLKWLRELVRDERGLTTLEYALVLALIVAAGVVAWQTFGETVNESGLSSTESMNRARVNRPDG